MESVERAARHLIETFGRRAVEVAEERARQASKTKGTKGSKAYGLTWTAIATEVREMQRRNGILVG
jgi:hypothetical protein